MERNNSWFTIIAIYFQPCRLYGVPCHESWPEPRTRAEAVFTYDEISTKLVAIQAAIAKHYGGASQTLVLVQF